MYLTSSSGVTCRNCQQAISGEHLIALGHHYHKVRQLACHCIISKIINLLLGTLYLFDMLEVITKQPSKNFDSNL